VITSGPGSRDAAIYRTDPATGRPTIFTVNAVGAANVMEVYQRIGNAWTHLYDFDAASVGETDPGKPYVQSPEPFVSAGRLYVAFVTSDTPDFSTTLKGNIRITRIDATGPPTFSRAERRDARSQAHRAGDPLPDERRPRRVLLAEGGGRRRRRVQSGRQHASTRAHRARAVNGIA
jgi:hypothetical protein